MEYVTLEDIAEDRECCYEKEYFKGQYTGVQDKNGTEIYEGDIVKASPKYYREPVEEIKTIIFEQGIFGIKSKNLTLLENEMLKLTAFNLEVIGNIYETVG